MTDQPESSHFQVLFDVALQDYQKKTGIALAKHPLAGKLENCDSVESVTDVLCEETQAFSEFWKNDKVLKPLKTVLSVLHNLSAAADFDHSISKHFPPVKAIHTGLGVLLSAVKGAIDSYDSLVNMLESFAGFLRRIDIYTKIEATVAMNEMIVKILVELLSTLALVTKQIKRGKIKKVVYKLFGENEVETVLQGVDRRTGEEARTTAAETLKIVHDLIHRQNERELREDCLADEKLRIDICKWLSPPDHLKNHDMACKLLHPGSAAWFIQGDVFAEWKSSDAPNPSCLWIHGKPGAGKSVFCSTIIEEIRKLRPASVAFFYCDFKEKEKTGLRGLLSSLLAQLCHQSDLYYDTLSKFYSEHKGGLDRPTDVALVRCLKDLLKHPGLAPVYLIVDALDECPNLSARSPRSEVLSLFKDLIESPFPNLRICVTSRPETDIIDVLELLIPRHVSLHDQRDHRRDIDIYIESVINEHQDFRRWKSEHKQLAIDVLQKKADGMFRWVECQVDYICKISIPAKIQEALKNLPKTLDETYERILREIAEPNQEYAHRLFQFVAVAFRPPRVEELAGLFALDLNAGTIPKFDEDLPQEDAVHAVLSTCSSLFTIVDGGSLSETADGESLSEADNGSGSKSVPDVCRPDVFDEEFFPQEADDGYRFGNVIQFSHYSVKEFLTSTRLAKATDNNLHRYHVLMTPAHTLAAQACLGILLHLDEDAITRDGLEKWPLAQYAARHWVLHAQFKGVSQNVEDGLKQLFDPRKPHFTFCFQCNKNRSLWARQRERGEDPFTPPGTPLHYAALWGFHCIVEFLITEHAQDVDSHSFIRGFTPLDLASTRGHVETARILIEHGADVAPKDDMITPLHLASITGRMEIADMLVERGADMTAQDRKGRTSLHLALNLKRIEVARMLIKKGADLTAQNKYGEIPLDLAAKEGEVELARMLVGRMDVKAKNEDGETLLHLAGQAEAGRMLIECGADVTAQNNHGETPLHLASSRGQSEVARMLIDCGADVTLQNNSGETPLHMASCNRSHWQRNLEEVARILIEHGADVTAQSNNGETPLHVASSWGEVEVARILIEGGADETVQDNNGETPLHLVLQLLRTRHTSWGYAWGREVIAQMLIERRVDVTARNKNGETLLHLASMAGGEIAYILVERGADVKARDKYGETPLHLASREGEEEVVRLLIEYGADVTAQNNNADTPLHLVSTPGQAQNHRKPRTCASIADMLLNNGADVNAQNKDGLTPFCLASQLQFPEAQRVLLEHGADPAGGETPAPESPPVTSSTHTQADLPIPSHPSLTTPNFADTDLPQTPSPSSQPPSDGDFPPKRNHHPVFSTRHFLLSLGIVVIAVAIPFLYKASRRR